MIHDDIHHLMPIDDNYYIKTGIEQHKYLFQTASNGRSSMTCRSNLQPATRGGELTQVSDDIGQEAVN